MKVKLLYFGITSEKTGKKEEWIDAISTLELLMQYLIQQYPGLKEIAFTLAVNEVICNESIGLNNGDIIALLPPFSGG